MRRFEKTRFAVLIIVFFVVTLAATEIIHVIEEDLSFDNAFYLVMTTNTTVGYGDVSAHTRAGRMFLSFYQLLGVSMFFYIFTFASK